MSNKPKFVMLTLRVSMPITDKLEEAKRLTEAQPVTKDSKNLPLKERVFRNAITLLGRDTDSPWGVTQKELDALMIFPDSYDVVAEGYNFETDEGTFIISLVVHPEDKAKWVDTTQIKMVAND